MLIQTGQRGPSLTLDDRQAEAVASPRGPTVVLGAPGTGKSTVVVERAARLLEAGVPRERITVVAVSRRSADDLSARLTARLGAASPPVPTFHSLCARLVRRHYREAGYRHPPRLLSTREAWRRLRRALETDDPERWLLFRDALGSRSLLALASDLVAGAADNGLSRAEILERLGAAGRAELGAAGRVPRQIPGAPEAGVPA